MPGSVIVVLLVGAWLVVLVPMLAQHRRQVRRASDAALATRVLYRGDGAVRLPGRRGPGRRYREIPMERAERVDTAEPTDTAELGNTAELGRGNGAYRYGGPLDTQRVQSLHRSGRGGFDPAADAMARRARFAARQRTVGILLVVVALTFALALVVGGVFWWVQVLADVALAGYLAFLRRQTRIEQRVRDRRLARINRARQGVDVVESPGETLPRRLRRPGAVVLEIDDEDPSFAELAEHTEQEYANELPRAAGQ